MQIVEKPLEFFGGAQEIFECEDTEVLYDGPAGPGKSFTLCHKARWLVEEYPGCRGLFLRQTRASLVETILLQIWEKECLTNLDKKYMGPRAAITRPSYDFPNGSRIVIGGLDNPTKVLSAQYDFVFAFQGEEISQEAYEIILTRLRNGMMPFQQMVLDCNPGPPHHWAIQRALAGKMTRIQAKHEDNPRFFTHELDDNGDWTGDGEWTAEGKQYISILNNLHGARKARLLYGEWRAEEGVIYEEFDYKTHVVGRPRKLEDLGIQYYFASGDYGFNAPGCLHVWGVDHERCMFLVAEVYRSGMQLDWWADVLADLDEKYKLKICVYDPSAKQVIDLFNRRLLKQGSRGGRIVKKAENDLKSGMDLVRYGLTGVNPSDIAGGRVVEGMPKLFFLKGGLVYGRDPDLVEARQPVCLLDEIQGFTWKKTEEGRPVKEDPDPKCPDHAMDSLRYACHYHFSHDFRRPKHQEAHKTPASIAGYIQRGKDKNKAKSLKARLQNDLMGEMEGWDG